MWSNGCFISHADCADDADLPCGLRHWNVPVARMAQMGKMKRLKHERMKRLKAIRCSLLRWTINAEPFARQTSAKSAKSACKKEREKIVCGAMGVLFLTQIAQMTQIYHAD